MDVFTALADPQRRSMLGSLSTGPARVVDLAAGRSISRPAVSKHLRVLTDAGLVRGTDRGRERHYELVVDALDPVTRLLDELTTGVAVHEPRLDQSALDALGTEVRRTTRERRAGNRTTPTHPQHEETA